MAAKSKSNSTEPETRTEVLHVRVTKSQWRQLKMIASINNRTMVNQVFVIIAEALRGGGGR